MPTQQEKCEAFRGLHHTGKAFVIPNPWDLGSAKLLQGLGFQALATTSVGLAYTLGVADYEISLDQLLAHCQALCDITNIPVTVDFENGFATDPEAVTRN